MHKVIDLSARRAAKALDWLFGHPSEAGFKPHHYDALREAYQRRGQVIYDADAILSEKGTGHPVEVDSAELDRLRRAAALIQQERLRRQPRCPE